MTHSYDISCLVIILLILTTKHLKAVPEEQRNLQQQKILIFYRPKEMPKIAPSRGKTNISVLPQHIGIYANSDVQQYISMFISSSRFFKQEIDCLHFGLKSGGKQSKHI